MRNEAAILCNAMTFFGTFAVFFGGEEGDTVVWPSKGGILFQI
ncbi:hypothetical protein [Paenibacillus ginsengarvi]|nr:hypothetical protein [Paenibacillus ginsengarvi]